MHPSALSVVALQPPGPPVQPDGQEVPPTAVPALLQAAAVAHLAALPAPAAHHCWWRPAAVRGSISSRFGPDTSGPARV